MRLTGPLLLALVACGCAERARYPKVDCNLSSMMPEAGQCTESSKIAAAVNAAEHAATYTMAQEAAISAAVDASPTEGPCPYGMHRCYHWAHDRRDDPPDEPPKIDPGDIGAIREYTRQFIDGVRSEKGVAHIVRDAELDDLAQRRAEQYRHQQYDLSRVPCTHCYELHGPGEGMWPMPIDQQVDTILSVMLRGGPGQAEHDALLSPDWHRAGVGIVNPGGELYFVVILAE